MPELALSQGRKNYGNITAHHETQVTPFIQEVSVDIDAVGFREIGGYELPDGREISGLFAAVILNVPDFGGC